MHNCRLENPISYLFMGCVCAFVCIYMQMLEVDIGCFPQFCSKLSGLESLSLNVELQIWLDWLARDLIICFLSAGIIGMPSPTSTFTYSFWGSFFPFIYGLWGSNQGLRGQYFTDWTFSPAPSVLNLFLEKKFIGLYTIMVKGHFKKLMYGFSRAMLTSPMMKNQGLS